jgi:hypothetical protein
MARVSAWLAGIEMVASGQSLKQKSKILSVTSQMRPYGLWQSRVSAIFWTVTSSSGASFNYPELPASHRSPYVCDSLDQQISPLSFHPLQLRKWPGWAISSYHCR